MRASILTLACIWISTVCCSLWAQQAPHRIPLETLESAYEQYRESAITQRRFKHVDIQPLIRKHSGAFSVEKLGQSVEGRSISALSWGKGDTKVMLWSQMHGNESTATMALFDLFNFLEASGDRYGKLRALLRDSLRLMFIPMLNPDGAEMFKRRNALNIDLNRDAVSQISPEAIILKEARDSFEPEFGFNLHDQQVYYSVGTTPKQATISLLAPAYNYETDINEVRLRAMKMIAGMNELLQQIIPGGVGKYDDAFEPRAFGDNIQKWGTSTILIESGGYWGDTEKQKIRKINFTILLDALHQIATQGYEPYTIDQYFSIPDNGFNLMDLIINEVQVRSNGKTYPIDIAIRRRESEANGSYYVTGTVEDLGDMQVYYGQDTLDASGLVYQAGKVYPITFGNIGDISEVQAYELLRQGYLAVKVENAQARQLHKLPVLVLKTTDTFSAGWMSGAAPNFFLAKDGHPRYAIVNGYLIDLSKPKKQDFHNRVY